MRARRSLISICFASAISVLIAGPAFAANGGENLSSIPDLLPQQYGRVTNQADQTQPNGVRSGYDSCGGVSGTEGAAAYKFSVPGGTVLDIDLTDDVDGQSVCRLELLSAGTGGSSPLTSIYDAAQRDSHRVTFDECPVAASVCHDRWVLPAGAPTDTYYLVVWPGGNNSPNFAAFSLSAAVRQPTTTTFALSGTHTTQKSGWFLITKGMKLVASATVSPSTLTSPVQFRIDRLTSGSWRRWSQATIAVSSARASVTIKFSQEGLYYVYGVYTGDETHALSTSRKQGVIVQTPTTQRGVISGYYKIDTADGYYLFRRSAYVTVSTTVLPAGATGTVTFLWYRLVSVGHTSFIRKTTIRLTNGRAAWRFSFRDPWHYYRIGTVYNGDQTHLPSSTKLMCIEIA